MADQGGEQGHRQRHVDVQPDLHDRLVLDVARDARGQCALAREHVDELAQCLGLAVKARLIQVQRYTNTTTHCNAQMQRNELTTYCAISEEGKALLKNAMDRLGLSARAYDRILKVARTIADLESSDNIELAHLSEAIQLRNLDRENWAG